MSTNIIDDFKLLDIVQQNNHLYDKNNPDYRDILKKTITWKAIGAVLGASGELCRKRFRCLRDRFNKERKVRQEEMLTDPALPAVYKKMLFLWDHLTHRRLVPVATRLSSEPNDDSRDAEDLTEEIEKQILLLKDENVEMLITPKEEDIKDSNSQNMVIDNSSGETRENDETIGQNVVVSSIAVSKSASIQPAQILFVKRVVKEDFEKCFEIYDADSSNDKQNICSDNNEDKKPEVINTTQKISKESPEKNNVSKRNKRVIPKLATKRKYLQSNFRRILPKPKRKVPQPKRKLIEPQRKLIEPQRKLPDSLLKSNSREVNLQGQGNVSSSRPSCNEAFCAVIKSYLDKITNSERLSATRLQILTTLHNELYSTSS